MKLIHAPNRPRQKLPFQAENCFVMFENVGNVRNSKEKKDRRKLWKLWKFKNLRKY